MDQLTTEMDEDKVDEDKRLRSDAPNNGRSNQVTREGADTELRDAKEALERKAQELAHSLAMVKATLEASTDGILVTNVDATITGFNQRYLDIWRVPRSPLGMLHLQLVDEFIDGQFKAPAHERAKIEAIHAAKPPETSDVLELVDGRVLERYSRIQVVDGRNVGRVWTFRDVTGRKRAEAALIEETHTLELLNRAGAAFATKLDLPSLMQLVTDAATQISGARYGAFFYNSKDEDGDAYVLHTLAGADSEAFTSLGHPRATPLFGPTFRGEMPIRCRDVREDPRYGKWGPHSGLPKGHPPVRSYLALPVKARSGQVIGGLFFGHPGTDVFTERTERIIVGIAAQAAVAIDNARLYEAAQKAAEERKRLLESERSAREEAERLSELKDVFFANLSHELRTPLNAIVGWSHVLRRGAKSEADITKGLETIERNARMQAKLIDDLLDMSRIASGTVRLDVQPVAPAVFVEAAIETMRPAAEVKGITLEKVFDPNVAPISGDPNRLQQVIWNLLSNAIKFTPRGGFVMVSLERLSSHIEISVTDSGIGIQPQFLAHVFERFRQSDTLTTRNYGGLGLGLSIVKYLVELHGGSVRAASEGEHRGATFTVRLPIPAVHLSPYGREWSVPVATTSPSVLAAADLSNVKVLVVDDETDARDLVERVLAECNAEVFTARSAAEALQILKLEWPHVLISDIGMPDVDGYEFLKRARVIAEARGEKLRAIALTAFAHPQDRTRALRAGYLIHFSKPIEPLEFVTTVARVAGRTGDHGE